MRNITLSFDEATLAQARILAARRGKSVSALIRDQLASLVTQDTRYQAAQAAARQRLSRGARLRFQPVARDELHERHALR